MPLTTVNIENLKEIKKKCIDLDITLKELVNEAVKEYLKKRSQK